MLAFIGILGGIIAGAQFAIGIRDQNPIIIGGGISTILTSLGISFQYLYMKMRKN